jgi:hypothetical protein
VLSGPTVILTLKVAVSAVTVLFLTSLVALARGRRRLHGRINLAFLVLTLATVFGLELLVRVLDPGAFDYFDEETRQALRVHLTFAVPAALLLPVTFLIGRLGRATLHVTLALVFSVLWAGTLITGIFLPHTAP